VEPQDAGAAAAARAEAAGRRTQEIADRLTRLATGQASDAADLQAAQQRADEAQDRAQRSLDRAVRGHERAALSHERTAAVHDEALRLGLGDAAEHRLRAEEHRRDAAADREEAALDRARLGMPPLHREDGEEPR
jgi:colicin import membrane protein